MKKVISVLILLSFLLIGCQSSENYLMEKRKLDSELNDMLDNISNLIDSKIEEDALMIEFYTTALEEFMPPLCKEMKKLKPSKEYEYFHELWTDYIEEVETLTNLVVEWGKADDETLVIDIKLALNRCSNTLEKATEEFLAVKESRSH